MSGWFINLLAVALFVVGIVVVVMVIRRLRRGSLSPALGLTIAVLLIAGLSVAFALFASGSAYDPAHDPNMPDREARLLDAGFNLLPATITADPRHANPYVPDLFGNGAGGRVTWLASSFLSLPLAARPSEQFHFTYTVTGAGVITATCTWENEAHLEGYGGIREDVVSRIEVAAGDDAPHAVYASCTAPNDPHVAYLRFGLRQSAHVEISDVRLAADSLRVEQWPDGRTAALAFSFDWESAMGGPIHSRGMTNHDVLSAEAEGIKMRQGADYLAKIFADHNIPATFYATGYDLLDGPPTAPDITYKWAGLKNGWASDYWLTHSWYSDKPSSVAANPAWYFGDQADRLYKLGHEIGSHTFGHLYVRGATPDQLDADLTRWQQAIAARGIPTATTFAFPWRSSNSVDQPFYDVLRKQGIAAVTRLYEKDVLFPFHFAVAPKSGGMLVVPDFLLGANSYEAAAPADSNNLSITSLPRAQQMIDADIAFGGVSSLWNHPLAVTDSDNQQLWAAVASYAAAQRDKGKLWIAPVRDIVSRHLAISQVRTVTLSSSPSAPDHDALLVVDVINPGGADITDVTVSADGEITSAKLGGVDTKLDPALAPQGKLVIGTLAAGKTIRVAVTVRQ